MEQTTLALFIHELRNQCVYTEAAFRVFNQSIEQQISAGVFFAAQATLLSASQISGLLWPLRARARKRGEDLRKALQLPEKHALNDKRLSSIWEHGDEKLEDWIGMTKGQKVVFDHVGTLASVSEIEVPDSNVYRLYDPSTTVFLYRGDGYKMQAIADAITDVYARVTTLHKAMFPEQVASEDASAAPIPVKEATPKEPAKKKATKAGTSKHKNKTRKTKK